MTTPRHLSVRQHDQLEVRGSAHERGCQYGTHYRDLLNQLIATNFDYHAKVFGRAKENVIERARVYRKFTEDFSSTIKEELRGIADGSGAKLDEIYMLAAYCELIYPTSRSADAMNHCTSFAVRNDATADGLTYVGQTDDESTHPWLNGECVTLVRYVQSEAPRALIYSYAGVPAQYGLNSAGLAVCVNALHYERAIDGVPMWCLVREVLNQKSVEDAITLIQKTKRAYSLNFVLGDTQQITDLETTPESVTIINSKDLLYHTNHYLRSKSPGIGSQETSSFANTKIRFQRIAELMEPMKGRFNLETLQAFLRDHENRPNSICSHSGENLVDRDSKTFSGMIYIPERGEAWLTRGNPCENEFIRYSV